MPSTITVQAPQSPTSQPSLAPVRWKWSRNSWSSVVSGGTEAVRGSPLTMIVTSDHAARSLGCAVARATAVAKARFTSTAMRSRR